jgi:hypothetical protein
MLRSNLATRPFYNDRAVRVGIALGVLLVAAFTTFNVMQVATLNARHADMAQRADAAERRAADYRRQAQTVRQSMNTVEMAAAQRAAQEANALIERRVFSWTELFNEFERTLPGDVRITAVEPQVDSAGRLLVAVTLLSRRPEDLSEFMDRLEDAGRFRDVLNRQDQPQDDGLTRSIIQGYYDHRGKPPTAAEPRSSEPEGSGNATPTSPQGNPPSTPRGER